MFGHGKWLAVDVVVELNLKHGREEAGRRSLSS